jgi:hypothetical protein
MERSGIATAALARNDRYLREFVEALRLCPFAKRCREEDKLHRRVVLPQDDAKAAVRDIDALASVEVALLIFPLAAVGSVEAARAFEAFAASLRGQTALFHCVAFHPDLPRDLTAAHRAVAFLRRSPDPTLQLVRISVLDAVRGEGGDRYVDARELSLQDLLGLHALPSLSERIAEANLETVQRESPAVLESLLTSLRPSGR